MAIKEQGVRLRLYDDTASGTQSAISNLSQLTKTADDINAKDVLGGGAQSTGMPGGVGGSNIVGGPDRFGDKMASSVDGLSRQIDGLGSAFSQAGRGDVAGGAISGVQSAGQGLKSILGALGASAATATMIGAPIALIAGMAAGVNKASQVYEGRMGGSRDVVALLDDFGDSIFKNSEKVQDAMLDTTFSVSKFGKTFEEGTAAAQEYLRAGGTKGGYLGAISEAAGYSMQYGIDMTGASRTQGTFQRYGGGNEVLDIVNGVMRAQGLGPGQYEELLTGMDEIFQSALSEGIVKDAGGIASAMELLGRGGALYSGQMGTELLKGIDSSMKGSTGLSAQEDIFMYRAASGITGGDFIETMKLMEGGITGEKGTELFQGYLEQIRDFTGGDRETMIKMVKEGLNLSYTQADKLLGLEGEESLTGDQIKIDQDFVGSREDRLIQSEEDIKAVLTHYGAVPAFGEKEQVMYDAANLSRGIADKYTREEIARQDKEVDKAEFRVKNALMYPETVIISPEKAVSDLGIYEMRRDMDEESGVLNKLMVAQREGKDTSSFYQAYSAFATEGAGISPQEYHQLSILLSELISVSKVTANNTGEDLTVTGPAGGGADNGYDYTKFSSGSK